MLSQQNDFSHESVGLACTNSPKDGDHDMNRGADSQKSLKTVKPLESIVGDERHAIWLALEVFIGHPIELINVAHSITPIWSNDSTRYKKRKLNSYFIETNAAEPMLRVSFVVCGPNEESFFECCDVELQNTKKGVSCQESQAKVQPSASMSLIRMVNNIPILDGCDALACGIVQDILSKKSPRLLRP
jgi:hypothetical protein